VPEDRDPAPQDRPAHRALVEENARLRAELGSVLESSSWRLTRPLRRLRGSGRPEVVPPPVPLVDLAEETVAEALPEPDPVAAEPTVPLFSPPGHFYSPIVDPAELEEEPRRSQVWPPRPREMPGVDWREPEQLALCREVFARQERLVFREEAGDDPTEYYALNDQYPPLDAWLLEAMLRWLRPRRVIEVGSGYSSLVTARVNRELLGGAMRFTCVEPYPRQFLVDGVPGVSDLIVSKIQDVPVDEFEALGAGDVLFVDTSHVVKTGGDVTWLLHEVIPRLAPGVAVHIHDIFLPRDYPEAWVQQNRSWNEQYLVHSFLAFNDTFEVVLSAAYMAALHRGELATAFPGWPSAKSSGGGALWLRRRV
jgi:predicted O-methyltransferase YrrM